MGIFAPQLLRCTDLVTWGQTHLSVSHQDTGALTRASGKPAHGPAMAHAAAHRACWAAHATGKAPPKPAWLHVRHQPPRAGTLSGVNRFWTRKIFTGEKSWSARDWLNTVGFFFFINLFLLLAFFYIEMQVPGHCSLKTRQTRTGTPPPPAFVLPTRGLRALLLRWTAWAIHFLDFISILNTAFVNFNIFLNFDRHLYYSGCEKLPLIEIPSL